MHPPVTFVSSVTSPDARTLAPAASHPTHALVTIMASTANSDAPRDESIRLFQSDATMENSRNDLDSGSIDEEDIAFEKLDPKEGKFQGVDLDLKEEDRAPMTLPTCCSPSAPHKVATTVVDALGSATSALGCVTCPAMVLPKGSIQVATLKHVEAVREETDLGLSSDTESDEGIRDALTLPDTQAGIQGTRAITTTIEKDYKKFHSKPKVDLFPKPSSKGADMFNGRKLQKKRAVDSDDAESSGTSTKHNKVISTRGRGGGTGRQRRRSRMPSTAYCPMLHEMDKLPPGFI
ncbi:uncharacterized protein LOC110436105 [Sorghum bicolor]|uniref:Uncharacterized protein n=1 Tax=Sorghum bicolor TaxID=4558 RepID=A0A1B6PLW9_SORBI|nr:uncharacterized protein LOC110436105 [Sorghum bicolor]KXG26666.1 hypothetical protein SORBI_3006G139400 [Sorghum bicolor]|eukprot:XP_021317961.1 uncharacterized protein LOC110436105 [Sorghum bicolor]